jgi:hypothetical protein
VTGWEIVFASLGLLSVGGLGSWFLLRPQIRKLRAETSKAVVEAAVAEDSAEDEHWNAIVRAQVDVLITPLQNEVTGLRNRVADLEGKFAALHLRYWRAIDHIRSTRRWVDTWHPDAQPPPPSVPDEIADDL